jgi:peptide/nickel transport system permease protein
LVTVITAIGMQISALFAFSVITERVFQWPGMGQLLLQAIEFSDVPLLAAFLVLIGAFFALTNLLIDGIYYLVDPRMRG